MTDCEKLVVKSSSVVFFYSFFTVIWKYVYNKVENNRQHDKPQKTP